MCTGFFEKNRTNAGKVTVIFEDNLDEGFWFLITHCISGKIILQEDFRFFISRLVFLKRSFRRGFQIFSFCTVFLKNNLREDFENIISTRYF